MKRLFLALALICLAGAANATCPVVPYIFKNGVPIPAPQINTNFESLRDCINVALPVPFFASNAALKAVSGSSTLWATRLGFTSAGDGGLASYNWSPSNCAAPDNGAQVQPSVTGCWIADFSVA